VGGIGGGIEILLSMGWCLMRLPRFIVGVAKLAPTEALELFTQCEQDRIFYKIVFYLLQAHIKAVN
jgi:hypothetical protein